MRRKDAEEWALEVERRIDRGEPVLVSRVRDTKTFGDIIQLHRDGLREVGKLMGRSKTASLAFLERRLGALRLPELDRERLIQFGKERANEGAGPVTLRLDLGDIKTILSHAAAVHGLAVAIEPIDLARIALARLGLIGKGNERDRRPTQDELNQGRTADRLVCRAGQQKTQIAAVQSNDYVASVGANPFDNHAAKFAERRRGPHRLLRACCVRATPRSFLWQLR
ncbi:MAG TPA: hypothetical protein VGJ20_45065 [Xanthobacteraceae bacterium]